MTISPLKVVIIFGGIDGEKNISLSTVRSFMDHSTYHKNVELFFMNDQLWFYKVPVSAIYSNHIEDFYGSMKGCGFFNLIELLSYLQQQKDIIVFNTIHGSIGEDGHLNHSLSLYNIPFTGSDFQAMDRVFDKYQFNNLMKKNGLKNIDYFLLPVNDLKSFLDIYGQLKNKIYILKPRRSGSSLGVQLIKEKNHLWNCIMNSWDKYGDMILEEYFQGIEFSLAVVDSHWQWQPKNKLIFTQTQEIYTYEKKYMISDSVKYSYHQCPTALENTIKNHCYNIVKALKFKGIVRIDGIVNGENFIINDCNTNPAMDQNSLLFKTKLGSLKQIFNSLIEENIGLYYPSLETHKKSYKRNFLNDEYYENYKNIIKNFLLKIGIDASDLSLVDNFQNKPMDVKIITGGNSNEKNVALLSGSNVYLQLSKSFLFNPSLYCWSQDMIYPMDYGDCGFTLVDNLITHLENPQPLLSWINQVQSNEFVFLGVHGGDGENGTIQNLLNHHYYNGSNSHWSKIFMDKYATSLKFHGSNTYKRILIDTINKRYRCNWQDNFEDYINQNHWIAYDEKKIIKTIVDLLGSSNYCWKPNDDGSSVGIKIIRGDKILPLDQKGLFILEEFINGDPWIELTAGVIGNYCLNPSITVASGEFLTMEEKFQYGLGINLMESSMLNGQQIGSIKHQLQNFMATIDFQSYCRVDLFYNRKTDEIHIIEVNSLPALTPATVLYHQGAVEGLTQQQLLEAIIFNDYIRKSRQK